MATWVHQNKTLVVVGLGTHKVHQLALSNIEILLIKIHPHHVYI
jgi:hypothetical protein